jgi:uncharacterized protein
MILKGKKVKGGKAEGEAIVSKLPFSYLGDLEVATGRIMVKGHDLEGQSLRNKIFVFTTGKGSTGGPRVAYLAKQQGNAPLGMICTEAEPVIAMAAIMNDIPMVHRLNEDPVSVIESGDYIKLDADRGRVQVIKKAKGT